MGHSFRTETSSLNMKQEILSIKVILLGILIFAGLLLIQIMIQTMFLSPSFSHIFAKKSYGKFDLDRKIYTLLFLASWISVPVFTGVLTGNLAKHRTLGHCSRVGLSLSELTVLPILVCMFLWGGFENQFRSADFITTILILLTIWPLVVVGGCLYKFWVQITN